jgi:hypothetical protein
VRSRIHVTTSSWLASPAATRSTVPASASTRGGLHRRPVASTKRAVSRNAARLSASGRGVVFGEVLEQHRGLLDQYGVGVGPAE